MGKFPHWLVWVPGQVLTNSDFVQNKVKNRLVPQIREVTRCGRAQVALSSSPTSAGFRKQFVLKEKKNDVYLFQIIYLKKHFNMSGVF